MLHDDQPEVAVLEIVVDPHDVRVVEGGERPGLGGEPLRVVRVEGVVPAGHQNLDGVASPERPVTYGYDQAEGPAPELFAKNVAR